MLSRALLRQVRPSLSRGVSQVLSDPATWNESPVVISTLPNGVRVATKQTFSEASSVGVFVDAGVRSETKDTAGATHLLEQLAFTGTANRSQAAFESEVESLGALLSANAGREQTSYVLTLAGSGDLAQGVDIVSDFVTGPAIGNFEKERSSLLRNLEEQDQTPREVIEDRLHITAFRDDSLGFSTIGPFEGIESLTTAHLQSYVDANFTAEKIVLAAAGPVTHEELVQLATKSLGGLRKGSPVVSTKPYFSGAELLYRNDEMGPTAYLSVGWEGVSRRSPDAVALMLCQALIGSYKKNQGLVPGNISGNRTINAIANKMDVGCADEFETFNISYKDTGLFGWYAQCDEVAVDHCVFELMQGVNWLSHTVTDEEVERAKRDLQRTLFGGSGSSSEACSKIGEQVLAYGRGISTAEMVLRINAIDAEEIKRVAWERFADAEVAITGLGPLHGLPPYMTLRRATNLHRY